MQNKTICIGIPCFQGADYQVLEDYMRLMFHVGRRCPEYNFQLAVKGKSEQFRARNAIVKASLQYGADYTLMLDDDHIIDIDGGAGFNAPTAKYDLPAVLAKHLEENHKIGVVGALYYQRGGDCYPVIMHEKDGLPYFLHNCEVSGKMQQVAVTGGGCMMIRNAIFDRIEDPWFAPEYEFGTDIQICKKARDAGWEVWCDTSIEIGHLRTEKEVVSSKKIKGNWKGDAT
jgi:GT2 family glycosyltransferase